MLTRFSGLTYDRHAVHAPSCGCNGANRQVKVSDEYTEVLLLSLNAVTDRNIDLCTDGVNVISA